MSLTSCLHKAKDTMHPDDFDAVLARAHALEDEGVATPVAERQAVQEVLEGVTAELGVATSHGANGAMTNQDVVDNQGGRFADDYQPGTVKFNSFDNDERAQERLNRIQNIEEEYRLPNIHQAVPKDYVPKESSQKTVTIYRGIPSSVKEASIRPGDWVGLSKKYAADHGTGETGKSKVISIDVPADHVAWAGTDMNEWFYAPRQPNEPTAPENGGDITRSAQRPEVMALYRGESVGNKGGKFYTPDYEWARQFTQSGQDHEIKAIGVKSAEIFDPETPFYGGDDDAIKEAIKQARSAGFKAVWLSEGPGEPRSVYVFNQTAIKPAPARSQEDIQQSAERPMFASHLQTAIEGVPDRLSTMAAPQWKLWLDANAGKLGIKKDEVEWSGIKDYLDLRGKDKVTRAEVMDYLQANGVQLGETVLGAVGVKDSEIIRQQNSPAVEDIAGEWFITGDGGDVVSGPFESEDDAEAHLNTAIGGVKSETKYHQYTLPGGTNYRELLITLPPAPRKELFDVVNKKDKTILRHAESREEAQSWLDDNKGMPAARGAEIIERQAGQPEAPEYRSSHWDQPNVLVHIRVDDRVDAEGKKVLMVQEIQSDWGQDGKKKGFNTPRSGKVEKDGDKFSIHWADGGVASGYASEVAAQRDLSKYADHNKTPLAPFVTDTKSWVALGLKRAIILAVQGGYDKVALINGQQSADFYDLSKSVDEIHWSRTDSKYDLIAKKRSEGVSHKIASDIPEENLADYVGKEIAQKIVAENGRRWQGTMSGVDLKVGGEGMKAFYDQLVPQVARDLLKKLGGGKLGEVSITGEKTYTESQDMKSLVIGNNSYQQPGFDITPDMVDKVNAGLPMFSTVRQKLDEVINAKTTSIVGETSRVHTPEQGDGIKKSTGRTATGADWDSPGESRFDDMVYKFQDKQIETKRVIEAIQTASGALADDLNVYLNEEMFHGRAAKRTEDFVNLELNPMIQEMAANGLTLADVEEFLHARHAREANDVIAKRNPGEPGLQDGGSGMSNATAASYLAGLAPDERAKLQAAADKVDAIIRATRKLYVDYELESQDTVDAWDGMFQHYIPLQREDKNASPGIGQGFSIKGKETKGRTGSTRKVVDILANVAMQRERAIVRGEKNRVAKSLIGMASANENADFWSVDQVPTERVHNPATGLVEERSDPMYKNRDNAVVAKIKDANGTVREHAVVFNEDDPRALRMAVALKNLDATQLEGLLGASAKITRYFAAVNTQYNPVFGVVNLVRDVQGAMLNLTSTPLANDKLKIAKYTGSALKAVYADLRAVRKGGVASSVWSSLWEDFQNVGGQTGYRDMFATSADRGEAIQKALDPTGWMDGKLGKVFTANGTLKVPLAQAQKQAGFLFDWLSDYNGAMENGVRLAAYKAGLERGLSREQAASIAKNLTTNFNRKGQASQQAGAMFAFFNAAIQGTARIGQTLFDMEPGKPKTLRLSAAGKKIVYGGILLGSVQAMALAAAGFGDEDPPEFARERSLIIPTGGKTYISIPMPLGLHIIPNIGRVATEFALSGFKNPVKRSIGLIGMFADAFNPIGNAGLSMQTLAPTALDPLVALTENKDWTGRPIAKTSFNKAIPGHTLGRDTSTAIGEVLAEAINALSGGNEHVAGVFSPTPDQVDYLIGQVTGGVGREYSKVEQSLKASVRGEALPTYKIPLVGRFIGNAEGQASEGSAFYANVDKLNEIETEAKGLKEAGKSQEARALLASKPEAYLIAQANTAESQARKLRKSKSELIKAGAPREQVIAIEAKITAVMARLNRSMEQMEKSKN